MFLPASFEPSHTWPTYDNRSWRWKDRETGHLEFVVGFLLGPLSLRGVWFSPLAAGTCIIIVHLFKSFFSTWCISYSVMSLHANDKFVVVFLCELFAYQNYLFKSYLRKNVCWKLVISILSKKVAQYVDLCIILCVCILLKTSSARHNLLKTSVDVSPENLTWQFIAHVKVSGNVAWPFFPQVY